MKRAKVFIKIIIPIIIVTGIFCSFIIYNSVQKNKDVSLVHKSEFYKLMYKENDIDFIKTGEKELEKIDKFIEHYKNNEDYNFWLFLNIQKTCLSREINKKGRQLLIDNKTINDDTDYDAYIKMHPESLASLKEKGKNIEYKEIDYIDLFRQYCIEWDSYDDYLYFCENHSIKPEKETADVDKQNKNTQNYFPRGVFSRVQNEILSSFLDYFDPVSIVSLKKGHNEIRFSCIDSGMMKGTYSYVIKVNWTRFSRSMEVIVEDSPVRHEKIEISKSELDKLLDLLEECDFYNQKSSLEINANDANEYVCEVNINGKYKLVSRCDYHMESFMYEIQNFLVKKTGGAPNHDSVQ